MSYKALISDGCFSDPSCSVPFKFVGCYKDRIKKGVPRQLPVLLFTDRDKSSKIYSGKPIDWGNWDTFIEGLVCRCAKEAKEKRYSHFGIQYYGRRISYDTVYVKYNAALSFNS